MFVMIRERIDETRLIRRSTEDGAVTAGRYESRTVIPGVSDSSIDGGYCVERVHRIRRFIRPIFGFVSIGLGGPNNGRDTQPTFFHNQSRSIHAFTVDSE